MNVVVFGATGGTGKAIVDQALAHGHVVTAFVRDPARMALAGETASAPERLRLVSGDVLDLSAVKQAVQGQDAVICSLGSSSLSATTIRAAGTANIIRAMEAAKVDRLLVVSAMGIGDSWSTLSVSARLFFSTVLRSARRDHEAQEAVVKASGLNWTILRPSGLTDEAATGTYAIGENIRAGSARIARADVAHAVLKALEEEAFVRQAVTVTN